MIQTKEPVMVATVPPPVPRRLPPPLPSRRRSPRTAWRRIRALPGAIGRGIEAVVGLVSLVAGLAAFASVPILQIFALGYLFESSGRLARGGRLRDAFPGIRPAARVGTFAFGAWLLSLPVRLARGWLLDARLIEPAGTAAGFLAILSGVLAGIVSVHLIAWGLRGGRARHFFRPIANVRWVLGRGRRPYRELAADGRDAALWAIERGRRLLSLGGRGFVASALVLAIPSFLLVAGRSRPGIGWTGAFLMAMVAMYLPFAQTRLAAENRFRAAFEWREVRRRFVKAPVSFLVALATGFVLAAPLYLLKIERLPADVLWIPSILFVALIWPARLGWAWAYARASRRERRAWFLVRWPARLLLLPAAAFYVLIVFLTQYTGWHGTLDVFQQHLFLLPAPLF